MIKFMLDQLVILDIGLCLRLVLDNFPASHIQPSDHKSPDHLIGLDLCTCTALDLKSTQVLHTRLWRLDHCWVSSFKAHQKDSSSPVDTCQLWCESHAMSLK